MAWYEIVMQHFLVVYHGISHLSVISSFLVYTLTKGLCVYEENKSDSWDIHGILLKSVG